MPDKRFFDTNLWIYLFMDSKEPEAVKKKEKVENLLKESAVSSFQRIFSLIWIFTTRSEL